MKILAAGGGSGGHVTPVVAVLKEIKAKLPDAEVRFWCDRVFGRQAQRIMSSWDDSVKVEQIVSGKLRRYNHLTVAQQLWKFRTIVWPNIVDTLKVTIGTVQSVAKMIAWRPDVVFTKGGYVCLPIGLAAKLLRIPLVIHDSDAHPGLTNRILAKVATTIATGAPLKFYPYPAAISQYVGVPVMPEFAPYDEARQRAAKAALGFDPARPLVVITGGGLGARRINNAVVAELPQLLALTNVALISGQAQFEEVLPVVPADDVRFKLYAFVDSGMADMLGAADIVVARAGATTILELSALAKPTILIPNAYLTGGHQVKNAAVYAESQAVSVIDEEQLDKQPSLLVDEVANLLADPMRRASMAERFLQFARPHAARDMAELVIAAIKNHK